MTELKESVLALPADQRHELLVWIHQLDGDYGDIPGAALDRIAAEIWDQDDHYAPPTHPTR